MSLNKSYWSQRYRDNRLGWDIGAVSDPLKNYIDQLEDRSLKILVPGSGYGHEVVYLWQQGFTEVYAADISAEPLRKISEQLPDFPDSHLLEGDVLQMEEGDYDLILEQTFFCSLLPSLRHDYVRAMHRLLKTGGKLAGVLFDTHFESDGPPFGGNAEEYEQLFSPLFRIKVLEPAYNSIPPRAGMELFFIFEKK